ncbi:hypothetical protein WN943_004678 [Citrus x changshan-huyou]
MAGHVDAQKRCNEELYKTGCTLLDCGQKCFERHNQKSGTCVQNREMTGYACVCVWTCGILAASTSWRAKAGK